MRHYIYKLVLLLGLLWLHGSFSSYTTTRTDQIAAVRSSFYEAVLDSKKAAPLLKKIASISPSSSLLKVYQGASYAIHAKTQWNPFEIISLLKKSRTTMNKAVAASPKSIEIRFIRFAVQKNIPGYLGYSKNLEEDKAFIIKNIHQFRLPSLDQNMKQYILKFLQEQGGYNLAEKAKIREALS